jgi:predicted transposase/invertase (TIGR01784 family)
LKTDSLFYRLFQTFPPLLFDLLKFTPVNSNYKFKSVEIKQTAFRLDGVFSPPENDHNSPLFFVEVQFQTDKRFYHRFFSEIFLYLRQFDPPNPWQGVVIYANRQTETGKTCHYDFLLASSRVHRIYLNELEPPVNAPISLKLLKLIVTPADKSAVLAQEIAKETYGEITQRPLQLQLIDLLETIMVYKLPILSREEIQQMMDIITSQQKH